MNNTADKSLEELFSRALETLAFIAALPPDCPPRAPDAAMLVRATFDGCALGAVELVAGEAFGVLLVSNLLAVSPDDPRCRPDMADALKELMNVVCGQVLRQHTDPAGRRFTMGIPQILTFDSSLEWDAFVASPGACVLDAEGSFIALRTRGEI